MRALLPLSSGRFAEEIRKLLGLEHCVVADSGRTLLYLLLTSLARKTSGKRDEVLLPGYTCYSVAASVARAGLKIRLYDLDPQTFRPDIDSLNRVAGKKTLAVVVQHLFGIPTPMEMVRERAEEVGFWIVEDCAQGLGGRMLNRPLGTFGDFALLSFGRGKPLPLGCGGALASCRRIELPGIPLGRRPWGAAALFSLLAAQVFSSPRLYRVAEILPLGLGRTVFDPGFAVAALPAWVDRLGSASLTLLQSLHAGRRETARIYGEILRPGQIVPVPTGSTPVYPRFPAMAGSGSISRELQRLGVRRMYPRALIDEDSIGHYFTERVEPTPGAREIARNLLTLPTHAAIGHSLAGEIASRVKEEYP